MIVAGSFAKMERIIKDKTEFDFEAWRPRLATDFYTTSLLRHDKGE
jgi:hypothetical protein